MQSIAQVRVTIADMRKVAFCSKGAREFAKQHNLDFSQFISEGTPALQLIALNDAMATKAVEQACARLGVPYPVENGN